MNNNGEELKAVGDCDLDDVCDGTQAFCKAAYKKNVVCRAATGPCDVEEVGETKRIVAVMKQCCVCISKRRCVLVTDRRVL